MARKGITSFNVSPVITKRVIPFKVEKIFSSKNPSPLMAKIVNPLNMITRLTTTLRDDIPKEV